MIEVTGHSEETPSKKQSKRPRIDESVRRRVLELRGRHSLREVAELTGLPIGTVKTLVSRSGVFRDNLAHREMFTLPPMRHSAETLPMVPELPLQEKVTGDREVDAMLWLRAVIGTGNPALIDLALESANKIKTPAKELEDRYVKHLLASHPGDWVAALRAFDFANLTSLAVQSRKNLALKLEGAARFGGLLMEDTIAEVFCKDALSNLKQTERWPYYDGADAAACFELQSTLLPRTLSDCLRELEYWDLLGEFRSAIDSGLGDHSPEVAVREAFVFDLMAEIRPLNRGEAKATLRYLIDNDRRNWSGYDAIIENLVG